MYPARYGAGQRQPSLPGGRDLARPVLPLAEAPGALPPRWGASPPAPRCAIRSAAALPPRAELMWRAFDLDVLARARCGGRWPGEHDARAPPGMGRHDPVVEDEIDV